MTTMSFDRVPETEVPAKATRRRFTKEYKLGILERADRCMISAERVKHFETLAFCI